MLFDHIIIESVIDEIQREVLIVLYVNHLSRGSSLDWPPFIQLFSHEKTLQWRGTGGGIPGEQGAGGVRETREVRAGGRISMMAGSWREIQKGSQRNEPNNVSWLPFNVFRGLKQNFIHEKSQNTKIRARDKKKKTALLPVKLESFLSRLHHRTWMR